MFTRDSNGALQYETNNYKYSLLEGIDDKGYTSDIVFIYREPKWSFDENNEPIDVINGCVVGLTYGGFDTGNRDYIEEQIKEHERKIKGDVNNE